MAKIPNPVLQIFVLNVGQGDTILIVSPNGELAVIDVIFPSKLISLINSICPQQKPAIQELIITHPHLDHYSGGTKLMSDCKVRRVTLAAQEPSLGTAGYHALINQIEKSNIPVAFLSSHATIHLDGSTSPNSISLSMLGPSKAVLRELKDANILTPNHLSIITRLRFGKFSMVLAADAQMQNWNSFDSEGMSKESAPVLKAAHHGSKLGTQFERIQSLRSKCIIVSSDPTARHKLPDSVGAAVFLECSKQKKLVCLTSDTGTIKISATLSGSYKTSCFGDRIDDLVDLSKEKPLSYENNPTNWSKLI